MSENWILTTAIVAITVTAAVGAQTGKVMDKRSKGDTMSTTYTGCVESVNHGSAFLLTKVDEMGASMHGDTAMKHDDMAMKGDAAQQHKMEAMPAKTFTLAGSNLVKYVGQKVSVTGSLSDSSMGTMSQDVSTLTVKTLKVIAKSCS